MLLGVLVFLSGCDAVRELQGATWGAAEEDPPAAADTDADSARVRMTFRPAERGSRQVDRGLGVFDAEIVLGGRTAAFTFDVPKRAAGVRGPEYEVILDQGFAYLKPLLEPTGLPEDKYWYYLPDDSLSEYLPQAGSVVDLLTDGELLRKASPTALPGRASERIRGVRTMRYDLPGGVREVARVAEIPRRRVDELRRLPAPARRFSFWVDADGFIRRMEFPMTDGPGGRGPLLVTTIEVFDFDAPLTIQLPPMEDVAQG